jgi:hypothetical protein
MGPHHHQAQARSMVAHKVEHSEIYRKPRHVNTNGDRILGAVVLIFCLIVVCSMAHLVKLYVMPLYDAKKQKQRREVI